MTPSRLKRMTMVRAPELCPELPLHLMPAGMTLDAFRSVHTDALGAQMPYWAVAWPGGQGLARYILDHAAIVENRTVADLGSGSGLAAIAAARAGARHVIAVDRDPIACAAALENARRNGVRLHTRTGDIGAVFIAEVDVILGGDLWYESFDARRATAVLRSYAQGGATVLAGDPGRGSFPRTGLKTLATFRVTAASDLESSRCLTVARILPSALPQRMPPGTGTQARIRQDRANFGPLGRPETCLPTDKPGNIPDGD